jgi:hypothetical protein
VNGLPSRLPDLLRDYGQRWQIRHDDEYGVWTALSRPTPASQRYLVAYDLPTLAAKLRAAQHDGR